MAVLAWLVLGPMMEAHAGTVTGRIIYGNVKTDTEDHLSTEAATIFLRGLSDNSPVPHVQVELWGATSIVPVDTYITGEDGYFSLETSDTYQTPNTLRVKALNDYVEVRESKIVPLWSDKAIHAEFPIYESEYDSDGDAELGDVEIDDDTHSFTAAGGTYPVSRALFVAGSVYRAARHIEELIGEALPPIVVRFGYYLDGAWYDQLTVPPTIHLKGDAAASIDHEYGHHIENTIGAFGIIPSYIPIPWSHDSCKEMTTDCWAFLEGLASWYGAVNSRGFTTVSDVNFYGDPEATSYYEALGDNWWVEDGTCSTSWTHPESVELVVAQVLWDLVDDHVETVAGKPPEVAEIPITDVLDVLQATGIFLPCWPTQPFYEHPVTLEQFAEVYLLLHAGEAVHPDIYAAFAYNGVEGLGGVEDTANPDAVSLSSDTHAKGVWQKVPDVDLTVTDGHDDFSGSFYYWMRKDTLATTSLGEGDAVLGAEDHQSKATVNHLVMTCAEGDGQYIHVQTRDLAGHLGTTAHYGPVRIDLTDPYWVFLDWPTTGTRNLIGTYLHFAWEAQDDLSGVDHISLSYTDPANGLANILPATIDAASGTYEFYLNPDFVLPTAAGYLSATVWDLAGNSMTVVSDPITVVSPFDGPNDLGLPLNPGRVVSGDLNGDGSDELVISGMNGLARTLQVIQLSPAAPVQVLAPGLAGGDLFLADIDRDGDLDIVAAGDFGGATPEIYTFQNDGKGVFVSLGPLPITGLDDMVIRVVDLNGTGEPMLIFGGKVGAGAAHKELRAYNLVTGGPVQFLAGTEFRGGDFEVGDVNADGIFDFVTLGYDAAGSGSLDWYLGSTQENQITWTRGTGTGALYPEIGDVDLGNWDLDNDLELFVMYYVSTPAGTEVHTELWEWTGATFELAIQGGGANQIAEGDGHIVDIYNDGLSDVFALGRRLSGALSSWYVTNDKLGRKGTGVPYPVKRNPLFHTDTAWGDFDHDGDLDVVVTGTGPGGTHATVWYESKIGTYGKPNADPPAPQNLQAVYDPARSGYVFSWEAPGVNTDETAETAFEYEIRVGTAPGLSDVVSWAHPAGHGQQVAPAYLGGRFGRFVAMAFGPVDWCVRAVDSGWRRSACAVVPAAAAVELNLVALPPSLALTENIAGSVKLNISNHGPAPASGVQLTVAAPAGLRFLAATNSAGTCAVTASNVTCTVGTLASNGIFTVDVALRPIFLPVASPVTVSLSNLTATVSSAETDLNSGDNSVGLPVSVRAQTDWGDARGGGFPVTEAENGPYHRYSPTAPWLGTRWDNDGGGNHSPLADFDDTHGATDDEDGIFFPSSLVPGTTATVIVICTNAPGLLEAWADFNRNTNWADAGEQIFTNQPVVLGMNTLFFNVPSSTAVGMMTTRWRLSSSGGLGYTGYGGFGEVEDHVATISAPAPALVAAGLLHATLGHATVSNGSNAVQISNLGSNGTDGVSIELGRADGWRTKLVHQLNASERLAGSRIEWTAYGEKSGQSNQLLISGRLERTDDGLALYADASPLGATGFLLEVLSNGVVVARTTVSSGRIARLRAPAGAPPRVPDSLALDWDAVAGRNYCWHRWFFDEDLTGRACEVVLGDLPDTVSVIRNSDSLRISAISPTATMDALSRAEFRGWNSGDFLLEDEAVGHLGAYLQAGGGTTVLSEPDRLQFFPDSNGVIRTSITAPALKDMTRNALAFRTPELALAAPGAAATFRASSAEGSSGTLTLSRIAGELVVDSRFTFTGEVSRVVVEMFTATSQVARLSLPAGELGTLSGASRIVTAGATQGGVPVLSVVFDAPMTFATGGFAAASAGQVPTATGFRVYPDEGQNQRVWAVLDRYDVETINEQRLEWIDQIIIRCPGGTQPRIDRLVRGERPRLSFATEAGVDYVVQSWDDLLGGTLATWQRVTGTGGVLTIEDPRESTATARFYRVIPAQESLWEGLRGLW